MVERDGAVVINHMTTCRMSRLHAEMTSYSWSSDLRPSYCEVSEPTAERDEEQGLTGSLGKSWEEWVRQEGVGWPIYVCIDWMIGGTGGWIREAQVVLFLNLISQGSPHKKYVRNSVREIRGTLPAPKQPLSSHVSKSMALQILPVTFHASIQSSRLVKSGRQPENLDLSVFSHWHWRTAARLASCWSLCYSSHVESSVCIEWVCWPFDSGTKSTTEITGFQYQAPLSQSGRLHINLCEKIIKRLFVSSQSFSS